MIPAIDRARLRAALAKTRAALLAERGPHGHWEGELSSSALSTATAVTALTLWQRHATPAAQTTAPNLSAIIDHGLHWLATHQNADGGWGDTTLSFSNISTTALCWAAFGAVPGAEARWSEVVRRAEVWLGKVISNKCLVISDRPPGADNQGLVISGQSANATPNAAVPPTHHSALITNYSSSPAPPLDRPALISALIARYGKDRTFSVPILTMCALAGRLGEGRAAWRRVIQLPFELAAVPQKFFAALRLPVVSYALPALIAIGQVRHHHRPTRNPLTRWLRNATRAKTLRVLERIQPPGGGFLEATPLTSFVTMSLAGCGHADHPVARRGVEFLRKSVRADGSWPIDTNLATWVTTLAVNALGPSIHEVMSAAERARILEWLLAQQYRTVHPYTNAAPGGWAWTDLPGGVPDADDTAGALLALKNLTSAPDFSRVNADDPSGKLLKQFPVPTAEDTRLKPGANENGTCAPTADVIQAATHSVDPRVRDAASAGVTWLLDLQNRDGGIPTFCRGWTNLPFDRSSPDITAHAVRAWLAWREFLPPQLQQRTLAAIIKALDFLVRVQQADGTWLPLWFGNQQMPDDENRTYGTTRVLLAVNAAVGFEFENKVEERLALCLQRASVAKAKAGVALAASQHGTGAWAGGKSGDCSVEETAIAVEASSAIAARMGRDARDARDCEQAKGAAVLGANWLLQRVEDDTWTRPAPIGFYFAKLWYYERMYPIVFTVAALEAVARLETTGVARPT